MFNDNYKNMLQDIVALMEREITNAKYNMEQGNVACVMFGMEKLISVSREIIADAMQDFKATMKANPLYRLAHDMNALYYDLDPYGSDKDCDESDAHYLMRISAGCDADIIRENLTALEELADDDTDLQRKVANFRKRLAKLTG